VRFTKTATSHFLYCELNIFISYRIDHEVYSIIVTRHVLTRPLTDIKSLITPIYMMLQNS